MDCGLEPRGHNRKFPNPCCRNLWSIEHLGCGVAGASKILVGGSWSIENLGWVPGASKILVAGWLEHQTRPRLARKQNIASEVGPTLQDAFFFPARSIREASARQHQARCSAQNGRCKLVCASCSTQVALCKLLCASCSAQAAPASWSLQVAPCKLLCASCAPCKLLCASCSVQVAVQVKLL